MWLVGVFLFVVRDVIGVDCTSYFIYSYIQHDLSGGRPFSNRSTDRTRGPTNSNHATPEQSTPRIHTCYYQELSQTTEKY